MYLNEDIPGIIPQLHKINKAFACIIDPLFYLTFLTLNITISSKVNFINHDIIHTFWLALNIISLCFLSIVYLITVILAFVKKEDVVEICKHISKIVLIESLVLITFLLYYCFAFKIYYDFLEWRFIVTIFLFIKILL